MNKEKRDMRITVISDSHRGFSAAERAIGAQPNSKHVIFLGDGLNNVVDLQYVFPDRQFYFVRGNCDYNNNYKSSNMIILENTAIFFTHGHNYGVKYGLSAFTTAAREKQAKIALYGHTHKPEIHYDDGLYILNPGSITSNSCGKNSYAVIDITKAGILPNIIFV